MPLFYWESTSTKKLLLFAAIMFFFFTLASTYQAYTITKAIQDYVNITCGVPNYNFNLTAIGGNFT